MKVHHGKVVLNDPFTFAVRFDQVLLKATELLVTAASTKKPKGKHSLCVSQRMCRRWSPFNKRVVLAGLRLDDRELAACWSQTFADKPIDEEFAKELARTWTRKVSVPASTPPLAVDMLASAVRASDSAAGPDGPTALGHRLALPVASPSPPSPSS